MKILCIEKPAAIVQTHGRVSVRDSIAAENTNDAGTIEPHIRSTVPSNGVAIRESKSISSFVAGFKTSFTARINTLRQTKDTPVWQERFHDYVIRNYEECRRIGAYIDSNIANWNNDRYYK